MIDSNTLRQLFKDLEEALLEKDLNSFIHGMQYILTFLPDAELQYSADHLSYAYNGLLSCIRNGYEDPQRITSFHDMLNKCWGFYWSLLYQYTIHYSKPLTSLAYQSKDIAQWKELQKPTGTVDEAKNHDTIISCLFNGIWLMKSLAPTHQQHLEELLQDPRVRLHDKQMLISALALSCRLLPESAKLSFLTRFCESNVPELQVRAMVNMELLSRFLSSKHLFDAELEHYYRIMGKAENQDKWYLIVKLIWETEETLRLNDKIQKILLPEIKKESTDPIKIVLPGEEEPSKAAQLIHRLFNEGKDVYYGTFRYLKQSSFFQEPANWFYPFSSAHHIIKKDSPEGKKNILELFINSLPFCNNDKWSMYFMLQKYNSRLNMIKGMMDRPTVDQPEMNWGRKCQDHVHELYRFFAHYLKETPSLSLLADIHAPMMYSSFTHFDESHQTRLLELSLRHRCWSEVTGFLEKQDTLNSQQLKLLGLSSFQSKDYVKAEKRFKQFLKMENNSQIKIHLITCLRHNKKWQEANGILNELIEEDAHNELKYRGLIASNLIEMHEFKNALEHLYKIHYFQPNDQQTLRGMVWCNLNDKQPHKALTYWEKISKKSKEDWLNGGHVYWALGDEKKAFQTYLHYFNTNPKNEKNDALLLKRDESVLKIYGINNDNIILMIQALLNTPGQAGA